MSADTETTETVCIGCDDAAPNDANPHGWCDECNAIAMVDGLAPYTPEAAQ